MSSTPHRASNSQGGKSRAKDVTLDLTTARKMLPLVRSIVSEIAETKQQLDHLTVEQEALDANRRKLDWVARQRRYTVHEEVNRAEQNLTSALCELKGLGVKLVDPSVGLVDFPTRINGRAAAFCWRIGEENLDHWHYAGEDEVRIIPSNWVFGTPIRSRQEL